MKGERERERENERVRTAARAGTLGKLTCQLPKSFKLRSIRGPLSENHFISRNPPRPDYFPRNAYTHTRPHTRSMILTVIKKPRISPTCRQKRVDRRRRSAVEPEGSRYLECRYERSNGGGTNWICLDGSFRARRVIDRRV